MVKTIYFDCIAGASGDMVVGALLDLGVELSGLQSVVASLGIAGCTLYSIDNGTYLLGRRAGLACELLDFIGDDCKTFTCLTCSSRLNCCV